MKLALFGYGKMGQTIERLAVDRGHQVVARVDQEFNEDISNADVAIDFSIPSAAYANIVRCIDAGLPVVSGTTGWLDNYTEVVDICNQKNGAFIYASNFSLGVNLFFELNKVLAKMMAPFSDYDVRMEEIHHVQKLDAPSGTAISLAEAIIEQTPKTNWSLDVTNGANSVPIVAKREKDVPGTHKVVYDASVDQIEIKHTAKNRDGFALGALVAAEWLKNKKGVFTMKDVLGL